MVRIRADDLPRAADPKRLKLLRQRREQDHSDLPEDAGIGPVGSASAGISPLRRAILDEMGRRGITRYRLWKQAREHCPTLPASAVYEYLNGQRDVGSGYLEAMIVALGLKLRPERQSA